MTPRDPNPRHGVIEYDDQDEWLTESDGEGAHQIVARNVPRWLGRLVVATLATPEPERLAEALCVAQEAGQRLDQVAPTTAEHWRGVARRAIEAMG